MSIAVVRRFPCQEEAAVAVSALWAADIPAFLFDTYWGRFYWYEQYVLAGYRVAVPASLKDEALAILNEAAPPKLSPQPDWATLVIFLVIAVCVILFVGIASLPLSSIVATMLYRARKKKRLAALGDHDFPTA